VSQTYLQHLGSIIQAPSLTLQVSYCVIHNDKVILKIDLIVRATFIIEDASGGYKNVHIIIKFKNLYFLRYKHFQVFIFYGSRNFLLEDVIWYG
jgi:hypothetical protein